MPGTLLPVLDEELLFKIPEIKRYFSAIGGFGGTSQVNTGMMFITLSPKSDRKRTQSEIMMQVRKELGQIKNLKAIIQDPSTRGFSAQRGFPIEFSIRGPEWATLVSESKRIEAFLKKDPRYVDLDTNYDEGMPEIRIHPNREAAMRLGVATEDIGKAVSELVGGSKVARFNDQGRRIDVRLKLDPQFAANPESILNLFVRNNRGELVPIKSVATLETQKSLVSITRQQRERAISLYSNVAPGASQADLVKKLEGLKSELKPGYRLVLGGSSKTFAESFDSLNFALLLGILIAYMVLGSQFNAFIHPVTVLVALPFSLTGAWFALYLGHQSLNIYSMIGLILLMGIVKKNSIMLVDFTNQVREHEHLPVLEALQKACPVRLRRAVRAYRSGSCVHRAAAARCSGASGSGAPSHGCRRT
jgi:multidrug efflux pump subunit AcrB